MHITCHHRRQSDQIALTITGGRRIGNPKAVQPVDLDIVVARSTSFDWLSSSDRGIHWVEVAPNTGRAQIASRADGREVVVLESAEVGNSLHAYGGRPFVVTPFGTIATLTADDQVWNLETGDRVTSGRYAHGDLTFGDDLVLCVRESDCSDQLLVLDLRAGTTDVVHEAPFIASPQLRDGRLAWTEWGADAMPWDSAVVWMADYRQGSLVNRVRVAGGPDESAHQPRWGPDGGLYVLSDRTGWWNLYRWSSSRLVAVAGMESDCGAAPWEAGYASYSFLQDGRVALIAQNGPVHRVLVVGPGRDVVEVATPYRSIKPFVETVSDRVALIGGAPDRGQQVAIVATDQPGVEVVRAGDTFDRAAISAPEILTLESAGEPITVAFYPAGGRDRTGPVIVRPHAGPTHNWNLRLDWEVQFFTSRGFAVADVDYRGSTGYGRDFRKALDGRWGEVDVEDCYSVAAWLVKDERAREDAIFISGASAGGYTALRAVSRADSPFALAVARSAIINPNRWVRTAPRFQRAHAAVLAHDAADMDPGLIVRPVLLIHGHDDIIAPIDDVAELARELAERDNLLQFLDLPGTGHYLTAAFAVRAALTAELGAYLDFMSTQP
jgi:dipeptidyl aminopeptidase/acylaminoacyl peptidase